MSRLVHVDEAELDRLRQRDRDADLYGDALMAIGAAIPGRMGTPYRSAMAIQRVLCPPIAGAVLDAGDFGRGDAGVLRLAALLAGAPTGAQVSVCGRVAQCLHGLWAVGAFGSSPAELAGLSPVTVIAWPTGGESWAP